MKETWLRQNERGTAFSLKLIVWIALNLGRGAGRFLLYPICAYFAVFSRKARRASSNFLQKALGRKVGFADVFRHYHVFASTILDRVFLLSGEWDMFDISVNGEKELLNRLEQGAGMILLGSHLGSFEILRAAGFFALKKPVNVLMFEDNAGKMSEIINALNPAFAEKIIAAGKPDTVIKVKEAIDRGEIVGILGDRGIGNGKMGDAAFLGDTAWFPSGPAVIASVIKAPVVLFFGIYLGNGKYDIHFEQFWDGGAVERSEREKFVADWIRRYAARLESYCKLAPYNWFNFFDFWNRNEKAG